MYILSQIKDLILDFAQMIAEAKCHGMLDESIEELKNNFVTKMISVRNEFPEYLFINYDQQISEEEAKEVFERIKNSKNFTIRIPEPQYACFYIDGIKLELSGINTWTNCELSKSNGIFFLEYDTNQNRIASINQTLLQILMTLPIKKIMFNFVDMEARYDYVFLTQNLPPMLYHEAPVTTEEQLLRLIDRLEQRKQEAISKYDIYWKYCNQNKTIPLPYEFVVLYDGDDSFSNDIYIKDYNKTLKRLDKLIVESARAGIYFIVPKKCTEVMSEPYYISHDSKLIYTAKVPESVLNGSDLVYTGLYYNYYERDFGVLDDINRCRFIRKEPCHKVAILIETPSIIIGVKTIQGFIFDNYKLELSIPDNLDPQYYEDLMFHFDQLNIAEQEQERIISIITGKSHCIVYSEAGEVHDKSTGYYRFSYWQTIKNKDDACSLVEQLVKHIDKISKEKWGENYWRHHLHIHKNDTNTYKYIYTTNDKFVAIPIKHSDKPANDGLINYTPIINNPTLLKACFEYIREGVEANGEMKVQYLDFGDAAESKYETDVSTMTIPVGKAEAKDVDYRMDLVSHVHSFIIGQSGSGKSVFLHNIIGGAMLKYAPEDLQLYLLDFKLGGVEFNRYQGAKHVKALLVDNSDPQVTLEILRELRNSMTERGKLLRSAGVNNIGEYNKLHNQNRMPHVLVVADECHEMFKADESIPRQVRNEISDIVVKIAKEGRSQGVHLIFATQTLSGTEISCEIINNVSDFYLLKCAQTDSERLVPNSSTITSELSTGQIYYHHVDEQVKFQAYYTDKEAAEKLMAAIVEKAKDHKSNGEFYFNGAQMFYLDEDVKEQIQKVKGKSPVAFLGKAIDISQKDLYIKLNEDFSENVLLLGLNDQEQVTRTTMNIFVSLMMTAKLKHKDIAFKVIDCLNNDEGEVHELIYDLENEGFCEIIERRQRSKFIKELALSVLDGTAEKTILLILGQDRFRELKMDLELEDVNSSKSSDDEMMSLSNDFFGEGSSSSSKVKTYKDALNVILEKGPDTGVHTMLQLEKASNLLFEDYITPKVVFQKFKHLVMLKSDETAGVTLHLNDDIRLEKLSNDWERLRAYYYAEESDNYTLFTPYMPSKSKDIINLLKTI